MLKLATILGLQNTTLMAHLLCLRQKVNKKMQGDWSMSDDGKIRTLVAKDTEGKTLFTRDVENITVKDDEYTYRIYPNADDRNVYFDIIHHVKK